MVRGVWLGEKHSVKDFNVVLLKKEIAPPSVKKDSINIPGADGHIDLTEILTGDVKYENRKISIEFEVFEKRIYWANTYSDMQNYLHGQQLKIVFDDDMNYIWTGRLEVNTWKSNNRTATIVVEGEVEPYKMDRFSTLQEWQWDPYNFHNGIIQEHVVLKDLVVDGERDIEIIGRRKWVTPTLITDSAMQVVFNGKSYSIPAGNTKVLGIIIKEGSNILKFKGNGKVSIDYRGGSL